MFTLPRTTPLLLKRIICFELVILFAFSIAPSRAQAADCTHYVSPDGNDSNSGTSLSSPFRTIQKGANSISAGDVLCVLGGNYHEVVTVHKSGTAANPINITAYPGQNPVIDGRSGVECLNCGLPNGSIASTDPVSGKGFNYNPLVGIEGDYVHFEGFTITRSMGRCVRIWTENRHVAGVVIRNNSIRDCRSGGVVLINKPDGTRIENNDVSMAGSFATYSRSAGSLDWSSGISSIFATNTIIKGNVIHENWGEGVIIGRDSAHTIFEDNVLYDNYALQLYVHATDDALVQRNLLYHTGNPEYFRGGGPSACIVITSAEPQWKTGDVTDIRVLNNIVTGCSSNISIWDGVGQVRDVTIANNTLVNANVPGGSPVGIRVGFSNQGNMSNVLITNNLVLQDSGNLISEHGQSGVTFINNLWSRANIPTRASSSGDVIGDPQLLKPYGALKAGAVQAQWYRIGPDSPAIGRASPLSQITKDFFGSTRDQAPDIGAHELEDIGTQSDIFFDVPPSHPFHDEIETLYEGGYIAGCSEEPLLFCPDDAMTRAESAVFIERGLWGAGILPGDPSIQVFDDLDIDSWAAKWAVGLFNDGYTAGCGTNPLTYCPWNEHSRTEGTVFFLRMLHGAEYVPPVPQGHP